jgi:5-hydroxyisourate hydrolase
MSGISTHVLDTAFGKPVAGLLVRLLRDSQELAVKTTDADGRCSSLLAAGTKLTPGNYVLRFETGAYFSETFFPEVAVCFRVDDSEGRYHVPLLLSPFGYSTYRGS